MNHPIIIGDQNITKKVNNFNYKNPYKYFASNWFLEKIVELKSEKIITEIIQMIFDNIKTIKSEDVLLFIEKEIGREEMEKLIGKDYIKRVKKYREDLFDDVFRYLKENNLQEYYPEMQERYYVPETIVEKY